MLLLVLISNSLFDCVAQIEICPFHIFRGNKGFLIIQVSLRGVHGNIPDCLISLHSRVHGRHCWLACHCFFGALRWPQNLCKWAVVHHQNRQEMKQTPGHFCSQATLCGSQGDVTLSSGPCTWLLLPFYFWPPWQFKKRSSVDLEQNKPSSILLAMVNNMLWKLLNPEWLNTVKFCFSHRS